MGVAASGKTTAGVALARALGWPFHDADDFHSAANRARMHAGVALTDADRAPWLADLRALVGHVLDRGGRAVLACSALTERYRQALVPDHEPAGAVRFVFLDVPRDVLHERLARRAHFFAPKLLDSQLSTLEEPRDAVRVDGTRPVSEIIDAIRRAFGI